MFRKLLSLNMRCTFRCSLCLYRPKLTANKNPLPTAKPKVMRHKEGFLFLKAYVCALFKIFYRIKFNCIFSSVASFRQCGFEKFVVCFVCQLTAVLQFQSVHLQPTIRGIWEPAYHTPTAAGSPACCVQCSIWHACANWGIWKKFIIMCDSIQYATAIIMCDSRQYATATIMCDSRQYATATNGIYVYSDCASCFTIQRQTDSQTDRQTDRHTDRQTDRCA